MDTIKEEEVLDITKEDYGYYTDSDSEDDVVETIEKMSIGELKERVESIRKLRTPIDYGTMTLNVAMFGLVLFGSFQAGRALRKYFDPPTDYRLLNKQKQDIIERLTIQNEEVEKEAFNQRQLNVEMFNGNDEKIKKVCELNEELQEENEELKQTIIKQGQMVELLQTEKVETSIIDDPTLSEASEYDTDEGEYFTSYGYQS